MCAEIEGEALGHVWRDATCTLPKTCTVCETTEGEALGHAWRDATYTSPKTCMTCGKTEGTVLPVESSGELPPAFGGARLGLRGELRDGSSAADGLKFVWR